MLGLYGFDIYEVFTGKAPLRLALSYLSRLAYEPTSVWRARQMGSLEHLGWTPDTYRLADLVDAIQVNTVVSANLGNNKAPEMPEPSYRPGLNEELKKHEEPATPMAPTLDDLNIHALARLVGGGIEDGD